LSKMGSALLDATTLDRSFSDSPGPLHAPPASTPPESPIALKFQVAQRLAAHRDRRDRLHPRSPARQPSDESPRPSPEPSSSAARAARIAAAVAERYARSPSYRAFLAAEADRAIREAQAAAEAAALNAQAVAQAQEQLLADLDSARIDLADLDAEELTRSDLTAPRYADNPLQEQVCAEETAPILALCPPPNRPPHASSKATRQRTPPTHGATHSEPTHAPAPSPQDRSDDPVAGLTVFLYEDAAASNLPVSTIAPVSASQRLIAAALAASHSKLRARQEEQTAAEARALDDEIAFRRAPVFEEPAGPPTPLPANLIEFPRQLVAPRKARPRGAEGPLRDDDIPAPDGSQLRIFEVDPAQISTTPETADAATPQWTSIWLDAPASGSGTNDAATASATQRTRRTWQSTHSAQSADPPATPHPRPQTATILRRLFAAAIDGSLILAGFVAFAAMFAFISLRATHLQQLRASANALLANHAGVQSSIALGAIAASIACLYLLYQLLFFSFSEATPGMRCARIALCTFADENPTRPAMRRRILAILLSACPLGLGFLWAALDEDRLAWHDLISRMYQRSY
jgi:uncharacterized RDD family membrane protein YckC